MNINIEKESTYWRHISNDARFTICCFTFASQFFSAKSHYTLHAQLYSCLTRKQTRDTETLRARALWYCAHATTNVYQNRKNTYNCTKLERRVQSKVDAVNGSVAIFDTPNSNQDNFYVLLYLLCSCLSVRTTRMPSARPSACINHNVCTNWPIPNWFHQAVIFLLHSFFLYSRVHLCPRAHYTKIHYSTTMHSATLSSSSLHAMAFETNIVPYVVIIYWH